MNTLSLVLAGILVYWLAVVVVRRQGLLPEYVKAQGPLLSLHTRRGRAFLNWLSGPRRFWRAWANFGVGVALVVMVLAFLVLVRSAVVQVYQPTPSAVTQPRSVLAIPGVNPFLPLSVAPEILAGLLIGLVVHEGGHGLLCRVEDIEIESLGVLLFTVIPLGAFVEPDEESRKCASRGGQTRMFAAGVTNNFAITVLAFGLLFGPVVGSIAVAPGVAVGQSLPGSAADQADIGKGDRITAVEGVPVADEAELEALLGNTSADTVAVEVNGEETVAVERRVLVTGIVSGGPTGLAREDTITAVNGTAVSTTSDLRAELANRTVATVETADGKSSTFPVGSFVSVASGGPLAEAGAPAGEAMVVTSVGGERVVSSDALTRALDATDPGQEVVVEGYLGGQRQTYTVELGTAQDGESGLLGVTVYPGISGAIVNDFGIRPYPAGGYLGILNGEDGRSAVQRSLVVLALPIAGVVGFGPFNWAGFTGGVSNFYVPTGPLEFLGGGIFLVANLLFWTGWINFNLAFFNCIPGYPLDGGHILRNATESVVSRLPIQDRQRATRAVTTTVGLTMLVSLLLMLFGQGLLVG